ncbi:MAG: HAD family hydrolase [Phycisphaerae bacterium]|nr:HAD family hydrolase [Phycisphaerae bacterium]
MKIKAVIFDLDGTITVPFFDFDMIRTEMGLTRDDGPVWEALRAMSENQRIRNEKILHEYEQLGIENSALNPGVEETIAALRQLDLKLGILTRNTAENALCVLKKHNLEFDHVLGREHGPVKPDCFGIICLCNKFGIPPANTMMVGDYLFDIDCAKNAGAVSVLLKNHENAHEFAEKADFAIDRFEDLLKIIQDHNTGNEAIR